ncbi:MSHA biogenesis protein MshP [Vibrio aquaticus]|uniref:MSHA biogenesis protein MshP n=1 Tax=Vibrio aquaticus TaxID=2496559 RepID=A0A3S0QBR4_9VIBR|nr:MSHA biogenesis protein MshP [Vibrio aquaticus]RTZ14319.1 MSHA biogenesis protein MshP [Vibrio aquaticus]
MSHKKNQQQGNLYIVVVFVLVVMGFLATSLMRIEWSNNDAHNRDVLGTQAWLLSQSLNEYVLTQFYPLNQAADVAGNCEPLEPTIITGAESLLATVPQCGELQLSCNEIGTLGDLSYFKVEARVTCGSGVFQVERSQEVWVRE